MAATAHGQRYVESLGRGVIAIRTSSTQVYVGWRLLGDDPTSTAFNVYRSLNGAAYTKLNATPISDYTNYLDTPGSTALASAISYRVTPVLNGVEQTTSAAYTLQGGSAVRSDGSYITVPLSTATPNVNSPTNKYDVKFCWVGDLDADGEYDFVVDRASTVTDENRYLEAYKRDGTFLWRMDMGPNSIGSVGNDANSAVIATGDKDSVTVYDLDSDGKAEVAVRTANGVSVKNAAGTEVARVTAGDDLTQFVSIIDGMTGVERARTTLPSPFLEHGPMYYQCAVAYLDGQRPSVIFSGENRANTGSFYRSTTAYDFRDGALSERWHWHTGDGTLQGAESHQVRVADVDNDGKDEFINIGYVTDDDGKTLFRIDDVTHGDRLHIADMDPENPGLETYAIQQNNGTMLATILYRSHSGETIKRWYTTGIVDVGRGLAVDINSANLGYEVFSTQPGIYNVKGEKIYTNSVWPFEGLWWDADLGREFISAANGDGTTPTIDNFSETSGGSGRVLSLYRNSVHQAFGGRPAFWGDLFGDWREEIVLVANDYTSLKIFTTTTVATNRIYTLMQNPAYRMQETTKGYAEGSYVDYYLGFGMTQPPPPPMARADLAWVGGNYPTTWDASTAAWRNTTNGAVTNFSSGKTVRFDIGGDNSSSIVLSGNLAPGAVTVYSPRDYTFDGAPGSLTGAMTLVKSGRGTLRLTGTNSYTNTTTIWDGALRVDGQLSGSPVTVWGGTWGGPKANGATGGRLAGSGTVSKAVTLNYGGAITPGAGTNAAGTLTLGAGLTANDGSVLVMDVSDNSAGTNNDRINITGNLALSGKVTLAINATSGNLPPGTYTLVNYTGTLTGSDTNIAVTLPDGTPYSLALGTNALKITIPVTRGPGSVTWVGGRSTNTWDLANIVNWANAGAADVFVANDAVTFDDTGTTNTNVTLNIIAPVSAMNVSGSANYTISGSGAIAGTNGLTKSGTGTLTLNTTNTFTGPVAIMGGVVAVKTLANEGMPSPLGVGGADATNLVMDGGTLSLVGAQTASARNFTIGSNGATFNISSTANGSLLGGNAAGTGKLIKTGPGMLVLDGTNSYTGGTTIKEGTLRITIASALGTGTVAFEGVSTLQSGANNADFNTPLFVGAGQTGTLLLTERTVIDGALTGSGTLNVSATSTIARDYWDGSAANFKGTINVYGGKRIDLRSNGGAFDSFTNATLNIDNAEVGGYNYSTGKTFYIGALSGTATAILTGSVYGGSGTFVVGSKNLDTTFAGTIRNGALTKVGSGALTLTGTNNPYAGATTVSSGKLILAGANIGGPLYVTTTYTTNTNTGVVTTNFVTNGYTAVTVSNNAAFGGFGTVYGSVTFRTNSTLLVNPAGPLAIIGNLTFSNGTIKVATAPGVSQPGGSATLYTCTGTNTGTPNFVWSDTNYSATLATNAPGQITATFSRNPADLTWTGVTDTNWNYPTTNWTWLNGQINFQDLDRVRFDDMSAVNTVNISNVVSPASVTVDASKNYTFSGTGGIGGTGTLTKAGTGTLTISTSNSYTGATYVNGGTLILPTNAVIGPGATTITGGKLMLQGGTLGSSNVIVGTNGALGGYGTIKGNVTFNSNSTLLVNPAGSPAITGNLTFSNGVVTVSAVPGASVVLGTSYKLYTYSGTLTGTPNFVWSDPNFGAMFVTNVPGQVTVTITRPPADLVWTGANGTNWNYSATNWSWVGGLVNYQDSDRVVFNDTAATNVVSITNLLTPASVAVNSTKNYAFSGTGSIRGTNALTKSGTGTLTITTTNSYSGGTYVNAGTLNLNANTAIGTGPIGLADGAALEIKTTITNNLVLAGTNNLVQVGTGNLYLTGKWQGSGTTRFAWISGQTFSLGTSSDLSGYSGTILLGSTGSNKFWFRLNPGNSTVSSLDYSTVAFDLGVGSDVLSTKSGVTTLRLGSVSGGTNTRISPADTTTLSIGARGENTTFTGSITGTSSTKLVKEGAGTLTLAGINHSYTGSTVVSAGGLLVTGYTVNATPVTVASNATIGGMGRLAGNLTMSNGARLALGFGSKATNGLTVAKTTTLNGNITVVPALLGGQLAAGTYTLLKYTNTLGGSPVFAWNDTTGSGYTATFNTNTAGTIKITLSPPLAAPTTLIATPGNAHVSLAWTAASGATSYNILRSTTSGTNYAAIASGLTYPSYTDAAVTNNTAYYYVVTASASGATSAYSPEVSAVPIPPPAAPINLTVTPGDAQVVLSWTAAASATSYTVLRSTTSGSGYAVVASGLTDNTYTDSAIANGTTYYYAVTASGDGGTSALSSQTSATPVGAPAAPGTLTAMAGNARVSLVWTASPNATSYSVLRSTTSGTDYATIASGVTDVSYADTNVINNSAYYYVVTASGTGGSSEYSPQAFAVPVAPPAAPANLAATAGKGQVSLVWDGVELAASYAVLRSTTSGSGYSQIASGLALPSCIDTAVTAGVTYYYVVTASNAGGTGPASAQASAIPAAPDIPPTAPANLIALGGSGVVNLVWSAATGAKTYTVKRLLTDGGYETLVTGVTSINFSDTSVVNDTTYYYVVSAVNDVGSSPDSTPASATPTAALTLLDTWRNTHFGTTENIGDAANDADPDSDGMQNLLEYAVGTDPNQPSTAAVQTQIVDNFLQITFSRINDPSLTYTVTASIDLASWIDLWSSTGTDNTEGPVTISDTTDISNFSRRFMRLNVTESP